MSGMSLTAVTSAASHFFSFRGLPCPRSISSAMRMMAAPKMSVGETAEPLDEKRRKGREDEKRHG